MDGSHMDPSGSCSRARTGSHCPTSPQMKDLGTLVGGAASSVCPGRISLHPLIVAPHALAREDHPDLIQNAKKSDIPEKPKTPQQLWYTHEKKVYLKVRPDVSVRPRGGGRGYVAVARGEPRQVGWAGCKGAGEEAPPQGWAAWTGPGPAGVRTCACLCVCVSLSLCTQAGLPPLRLPLLACGGHFCDLLWPEGAGASVPPTPSLPPAPGCLCVSDGFWFAGHYEGGEGLPGEAVVSALGQKEAEMDS